MRTELEQHGVSLLALSNDSPDEVAIHKKRDGLHLDLLSDAHLKVIRQYGLEHQKAFGFETKGFQMFGIPLSLKPKFKSMAIPTSILIDEQGVIRWIDQADDYRIRSNRDHVLHAVKSIFDTGGQGTGD